MKKAIQLLGSLAVTAFFMWWTFKDTRWPEMWASLKEADYIWFVPYFGLLTLVHICRTLRWGHLLAGMERIPFKKLNEAAAIGFMMLIILPFRLGEFARPFLIAQRSGIRRSPAMTTVVLERIVDGIVVALMLRGFLFFVPGETPEIARVRWGGNLMLAVFGGGLLFLLFATWQQARAVGLIKATAGRISENAGERIAYVVEGFVGAMRKLPRGADLFWFFFYTIVYWGLNGVGMSLLTKAFGCGDAVGTACQPLSLSIFQGFVVLCVLVVGLMIPAAPGSAGTFQAFVLLGMAVFVPAATVNGAGVAFANVIWLAQIGQQILFGLIFMLLGQQSFSDITSKLGTEEGAR